MVDDQRLSIEEDLARKRGLERDILSELIESRCRAWRITYLCLAISALSAVALATIFPLKPPPELAIVRVNEATGDISQVSTSLSDAQETYGERLNRFFIHQYILACESYDWNTIQNTYDRCGLFSSPDVQRAYYQKFQGDNALDKTYAQHTRVIPTVRSITPGPNNTATVRWERRTVGSNNALLTENLISTMAFQYINGKMTEAVGRDNPLGFQVITYTTDVETR